MQTFYELESKAFAAGGNVQVSFRDAPAGKRVRGIIVALEAVFTQGGAAALIPGSQLCRVFSSIILGQRYRTTGAMMAFLEWIMRGRQVTLPASIPATNAGVFRRHLSFFIPFENPNAFSPLDACPVTDYFRDTPLVIDFAVPTGLWASLANVTGTLRTTLVLDDADAGVAPSISTIGYGDYQGQTIILEPGLYSHLFAFRENLGSIDSAEVATLSLRADGQVVNDLVRTYEMARWQDYVFGMGADLRTDDATNPVPGEQLTDDPPVGNGAAAAVELEYLPLYVAPKNHKATDLLLVENTLRLDFTGTEAGLRIGWRRFEARSETALTKALVKNGVPAPSLDRVVVKTASKTPLSPSKSRFGRYLPARHLPG